MLNGRTFSNLLDFTFSEVKNYYSLCFPGRQFFYSFHFANNFFFKFKLIKIASDASLHRKLSVGRTTVNLLLILLNPNFHKNYIRVSLI